MNVKNIERKEKSLVEMQIEVDRETFAAAVSTAFRKNAAKMNVPGFRKGKAPRKIIEAMYGQGVFYQDAVEATWQAAYDRAVETEGLEPVERPDVGVDEIGEDGYIFTARVHVYPEVEIGQYRGLSAYAPPVAIDEGEVDAEIERLRERNASLVTAERPAKMGDTVVIDFEGFIDGIAFDGGKGEMHSLELGSGRFIPGFEEKLEGFSAGDLPDVEIEFPQDYQAEHLAGKPAVFKCKVHEVKEKKLPETDDEFAKDISEFETLEEYKESLRKRILEVREREAENLFENALLDKIIPTLQGDIPESMISQRLESIITDFSYSLRQRGMDLEGYMRMTGMDEKMFVAQFRPQAEKQTKCGIIFDKIVKLENIELAEGELDAEYARLAEMYKMSEEETRRSVNAKSLGSDLLALKASKIITDTAVRLDKPETVEEPKKPAGKKKADGGSGDKPKAAKKTAGKKEEA
jgi:trigger factor